LSFLIKEKSPKGDGQEKQNKPIRIEQHGYIMKDMVVLSKLAEFGILSGLWGFVPDGFFPGLVPRSIPIPPPAQISRLVGQMIAQA